MGNEQVKGVQRIGTIIRVWYVQKLLHVRGSSHGEGKKWVVRTAPDSESLAILPHPSKAVSLRSVLPEDTRTSGISAPVILW